MRRTKQKRSSRTSSQRTFSYMTRILNSDRFHAKVPWWEIRLFARTFKFSRKSINASTHIPKTSPAAIVISAFSFQISRYIRTKRSAACPLERYEKNVFMCSEEIWYYVDRKRPVERSLTSDHNCDDAVFIWTSLNDLLLSKIQNWYYHYKTIFNKINLNLKIY